MTDGMAAGCAANGYGSRPRAAGERASYALACGSRLTRSVRCIMQSGTLQSLLAEFNPELPLERAKTIPNTWYTSPEIARLERDAVFARTWQVVGRREQVSHPRQFLTANIDGEPILVVRDEDGVLRAFFNV